MAPTLKQVIGTAKAIRGVVISCHADMDASGGKKYVPVRVPNSNPVFRDFGIKGDVLSDSDAIPSSPVPDISQLVNMMVQIRKIPPRDAWDDRRSYINQEATSLLVSMNPKSESWGFAPEYWQSKVGSVVVTGVGGAGITPQEIEALCAYSRGFFEEHMEDCEDEDCEDEGTVADRKKVVGTVTPMAFFDFFEDFRREKLKEDPAWDDFTKPAVLMSNGTTSSYIETS